MDLRRNPGYCFPCYQRVAQDTPTISTGPVEQLLVCSERSAVQCPRKPLHSAEMHHLLGKQSNAFQLLGMAGHQERSGKLCGGSTQEGEPDSGVVQYVTFPTGELTELLLFAPTFPHLPPPEGSRDGCIHQLPFPSSPASLLMLPPPVGLWLPDCQPHHPQHTYVPSSAQTASRAATSGLGERMPLHSRALFSTKLQLYEAASHKEGAAQDLSR